MSVFVYGSLLAPEVLQVLLGRKPQSKTAVLSGYQRFAIKGRPYPAIVKAVDCCVYGQVFDCLTVSERKVFDLFEGDAYNLTPVQVKLEENGETAAAQVYVYVEHTQDLCGEWDYESFRQISLKDYVEMCKEFMKEIDSDISQIMDRRHN
mmetsp:Transcript_27564/g.38055  ORF Transcript_27564/g.38055 Transcript_27564/m.38055 type:complete len:150 (-) Transcript_27564:190-639(-)